MEGRSEVVIDGQAAFTADGGVRIEGMTPVADLVTKTSRDAVACHGLRSLTPQELRVALIVAQGSTNREAAAALFLSPKTVEFHLANTYRKLGARSRAELVRRVEGLT